MGFPQRRGTDSVFLCCQRAFHFFILQEEPRRNKHLGTRSTKRRQCRFCDVTAKHVVNKVFFLCDYFNRADLFSSQSACREFGITVVFYVDVAFGRLARPLTVRSKVGRAKRAFQFFDWMHQTQVQPHCTPTRLQQMQSSVQLSRNARSPSFGSPPPSAWGRPRPKE